jgi:hypothetical protein
LMNFNTREDATWRGAPCGRRAGQAWHAGAAYGRHAGRGKTALCRYKLLCAAEGLLSAKLRVSYSRPLSGLRIHVLAAIVPAVLSRLLGELL